MGDVDIISPFAIHPEIPRTILQRYQLGLLQYKVPVDITFFILVIVLKPEKQDGRFKREILAFFHTFE